MHKVALLTLTLISLFSNRINEKVLVCALTKNNEARLTGMLKSVTRMCSFFKDYRILIFENNSMDQTKQILQKFQNTSKKNIIFSTDYSEEQLQSFSKSKQWDFAPARVELIATFRNKLLDEVFKQKYEDFTYVIVIDLDLILPKSTGKTLIDTFKVKDSWDAVFANGCHRTGTRIASYYDLFALRSDQYPIGPELDPNWWDHLKPVNFDTDQYIRVYSAFGGLGIYKKQALRGCRYSGIANEYVSKFTKQLLKKKEVRQTPAVIRYYNFIKRLRKTGSTYNIDLTDPKNTNFKANSYKTATVSKEARSLEFLINCCGHIHYPIICEHVPLHYQMILNGYDRLFVNPKLHIFTS